MLLILRFGFIGLLALCGVPRVAQAQDEFVGSGNPGHGEILFRTELYNNPDDGDGNPFLDEALTVVEPALVFIYNINERLSTTSKLSFDYVSSASIERLRKFEEQSGASGDTYLGLDLGLNYELSERTRTGGFVSGSFEYDYFSLGLGGNLARDNADHTSTLQLSANGFYDIVDIIRFDGKQNEGTEPRLSASGSATWYRILNPSTHGELGATVTVQSGFLETAFNSVVIEDASMEPNPNLINLARGFEITEEMPDTRVRTALFGQIRHTPGARTAVGISARGYIDSWGIQSVTMEPRFYAWLKPDRLQARFRYRYYTQSAADAYQDRFFAETAERTQDSDLGAYQIHGGGLKLDWHLNDSVVLDFSGDVAMRSDGIRIIFGGTGIRRTF